MGRGYGIEQWEIEEMNERMKGLDPLFDNHPSVVEQRKLRDKLIQDCEEKPAAWQFRFKCWSGEWSEWSTMPDSWDGVRNPDCEYRPLYQR